MTLSKILSAAVIASATLATVAPALAIVPGSEHYRERAEQVERQAVANGIGTRPNATRSQAIGTGGTFGYAAGPGERRGASVSVSETDPINNNHYRDRADELSRRQIQAR